jgi:propanol-preferring alcohol dehydrogenase
MVVVGAAPDAISVDTTDLIFGTRTISGSLTGSSVENEDNIAFSQRSGIHPMIEIMPMADAPRRTHA